MGETEERVGMRAFQAVYLICEETVDALDRDRKTLCDSALKITG